MKMFTEKPKYVHSYLTEQDLFLLELACFSLLDDGGYSLTPAEISHLHHMMFKMRALRLTRFTRFDCH